MRKPKIVIVGAGPAGSACAIELARSPGFEVELLDRSVYPRRKVCGSGLGPHALEVLEEMGLKSKFAPLAVPMAGIYAKGPGGASVRLRGKTGAWIVPRTEFDHGLVEQAVRGGVKFSEGVRVDGLLRDPDGTVRGVETSDGEREADIVVCANGSPSKFERDERPRYGIRTIMGWWKGANLDEPDMGVMIWDRRLEGYYAWLFPEPHGIVNIGLTIPDTAEQSHHLRALFTELLDEHFAKTIEGAELVGKWQGHPVTSTLRVGDICESRAIWIGEAARLVSPGTVEGIGFALESGLIGARTIVAHADANHGFSPLHQAGYRTRIGKSILAKFWAGEALVRVMRSSRARSIASSVFDPQWAARAAASLMDRPEVA